MGLRDALMVDWLPWIITWVLMFGLVILGLRGLNMVGRNLIATALAAVQGGAGIPKVKLGDLLGYAGMKILDSGIVENKLQEWAGGKTK